jgi:predicted ATP-binding protein involved in virulence
MRIDSLRLTNFKGFDRRELKFHPQFNLIVGENGTGKTSVLEALSIAVGSWFLGMRAYDSRHIRPADVRLVGMDTPDGVRWEQQYPTTIGAAGELMGEAVTWSRTLASPSGRTTYVDARSVKTRAARAQAEIERGASVTLPLLSYYGTGRLWNVPRETAKVRGVEKVAGSARRSRLSAYANSVDPRLSVSELVAWIARESWRSFQKGGTDSLVFSRAREAMIRHVDRAEDVYFDAEYGEVVLRLAGGERQPFNNLSDGQRSMLALVGDLGRKAATLNPHLGGDVLGETPGVVLIDELDLHLHPKWQRRVIEDLRSTFPSLQFFATTHSPFLIQSLRSGEELVMLEGQPLSGAGNLPIEEIARGIQGVEHPEVSARYDEMRTVARHYLEVLEEVASSPADKLERYREQLAASIAPYADNPAFQAFLEMKRAAKLGE